MRSIWSRIWNSPISTISRKKPQPRKSRLGVELLEDRLVPATLVSLDPAGNLTIEDVVGASTNDRITIQSDTANTQFVINDPANLLDTNIAGASGGGTNAVTVPFAAVNGTAIVVSSFAGDDELTVDLGLGNFAQTITYDGGASGTAGDALKLQGGGAFASVTHTFTSASAGSVAVSGNGLLSYSGLEDPTNDLLAVADRAFVGNGGAETIYVLDLAGAPLMAVDSSHGLAVIFFSPTASMTIDAGAGNDAVNLVSVDGGFGASLIIHGGTGDDTIDLAADINFNANRNLDVDLQNDDAAPGVDFIHVAVNTNMVLSGTGTATLKASKHIIMESGSSIVTADGNLVLAANQQATPTGGGAFIGVEVNAATVQSTGSGLVQLLGKGGTTGTNNSGVRVTGGSALVQSGSGLLQVIGTGGASSGANNAGVFVETLGAAIRSAGGNIQITGTGGGTGASFGNTGVLIRSAEIRAGGTGSVNVQGAGGTTSGGPNRGVELIGGLITSSGGDVQVTGAGGAVLGTNGANVGVFVGATGQISAAGNGSVNVQGTGSTAGGVNNHGVHVTGDISRIASSGGNIQVTGTQGAGSGSFAVALTANGSVITGAGTIDLIGDSMNVDPTAFVNAGTNTIRLRQRTNGVAINLGGADAAGVLGLTDAELDRMTAATMNIGDTNAGSIAIASISRSVPTAFSVTTGSNISLVGTGALFDSNGAVTLSAPNGSITTPPGSSVTAPDVAAASLVVDGIVAPGGASPGEFAVVGSFVFSSTDRYHAQVNGIGATSQYDKISVFGAATLGSAILDISLGFVPTAGQMFVLVDTSAGVLGTFRDTLGNPLNEGATFPLNGVTFSITYAGGADNRDVVLTALTSGVTLSIGDRMLAEGNSGTTTFTFDVTLSAPGAQTVSVNYATANGTATVADGDYVAAGDTLTFAPGETSKQVTVTVNGDAKFEPTEVFVVNLSAPVNAAIGDGQGLGTIVNDDNQPTVSIDDVSANEGTFTATTFTFTVSLSNPSSQTVTVNYQTADGSATAADGDYVSTNDTLTFAPGETSKTITIAINADDKFEPAETFSVNLVGAGNATIADGSGLGTIVNDDAAPTISVNDVSIFEFNSGATGLTFPVLLSNPSYQTITVDFVTADGTATLADNDYQFATGTLTFTPGQTAKTVTVLINGDTKFEANETFALNLSAATNAVIADPTAVGSIQNDDAPPTISINDVSMLEGNAGATAFVFAVSLSNPSSQTVSVAFATADGTALLSDGDYQSANGTLTFNPNQTSQSVTVLVTGDTKFEANETFVVNLSSAANATIADGAGLGTVQNDDAQPAISIGDVSLFEGNAGSTNAVFIVTLSNPSSQTIAVDFATAYGTAMPADNDFQSIAGTLTFTPGQTSQTISVPVNGDTKFEPDEDFAVLLSNATNASIADGIGLGTIQNDDNQPTISINDASILEGNSGATGVVFTVSLSNESAQTITVNFATSDGTATVADGDYQTATGTLTFQPGQTSQTITVLVNGDTKYELNETFAVNLSGAANASIADATGAGTIQNDDPLPTISVNDVSVAEGHSGPTSYVFTVNLSNASSQTITVAYATADGSATLADNDYQSAGGVLTFAPGQTSQSVTVFVNGDARLELDETLFVNLSGATMATIFDGQGLGTVLNDDAPPAISIDDVTRIEGNEGTVAYVFTLTLSSASPQPITVAYATANGSAVSGSDYITASGVATFDPEQTVTTITVLVNSDRVGEENETFFVNLSGATNATIADGQGAGLIQDDEPRISIGDVTIQEGKKGTTLFTFTITLSVAYDQAVTFLFRTSNGTAASNSDYQAQTGMRTFDPFDTTETITIEVKGDNRQEADEVFYVDIFNNSSNSLITKNRGIGTILNDD